MLKNKIGFNTKNEFTNEELHTVENKVSKPKKSLVQVYFPKRGLNLAYYNDSFDLKCEDRVYVDGKLEGYVGIVTSVNYNFKIKISDYKRVIALIDTRVKGQFYGYGTHFITFDSQAVPYNKVINWFKAPVNEDEEYVQGYDDASFDLVDFNGFDITESVAERGHNYYREGNVVYLSLQGKKGYAIVEGSEFYEIEFRYNKGKISNMVCSCYCSYNCKHEFATMLQLKEFLALIEDKYSDEFNKTKYFAAINKVKLFTYAVDSNDGGKLVLWVWDMV